MGSKTFADFVDITMGQSPPGDKVSKDSSGRPLLNGPTEFGPHHPTPVQFTTDARKCARAGDILFCVRGSTTGRMNWADQDYAIGRGVAAIRHRDEPELQSFVRGVIEIELPALLAQATGSTFPNVSAAQLAALPYPSLGEDEQRAIAHILGTLDDKIELNRRMNGTLEAMTRAIFKSWFVDSDPVRIKAERGHPGLPDEMVDLFPDSFEDSELGPIPEGWEIKPIGEAVRCVGGSTPSTKNPAFWNGGTNPFVTPKDMSSLTSPVILDTARHITDAGVDMISSRRLPAGTVLLSSRAPIGYLAITEVSVSVNQGIIAMICDKGLPNYYVLYWTEANMDTIKNNAGGTTFAEISKRNFRPIKVIIPHERVLEAYVQQIEPLHQQIVLNLQDSNTLGSLRDTLLPKLISGEVRVPDAEKFVEEAGV